MRRFGIIILFVALAVIGNSLFSNRDVRLSKEDISQVLPMEIAGYKGKTVALPKYVYDILGSNNVLVRAYTKDDKTITVSVVISQSDRRVVHPPEVCLHGSGNAVRQKEIVDIDGWKVNRITVGDGGESFVYYWYRLNKADYTSYLAMQAKIVVMRLLNRPVVSALVRVSGPAGSVKEIERLAKEVDRCLGI